MLVRELMTSDPVTVTQDTPVKVALGLLSRHGITSMPVLGRRGRLRGVVSEADLIREMVPADPRAHEVPIEGQWQDRPHVVADVMTAHAVTVSPETDLARAVELITTTTVKSVPVVDHDDRVVGMLSRSDVVRVLARADDDLAREVDAMLASRGAQGLGGRGDRRHRRAHGPEGSPDRALAHLVAGTVPGVVEVNGD